MDRQYLNSLTKPSIDEHYNFTNCANLTAMVDKAYNIFASYSLIEPTGMCPCDICFHDPLINDWASYSDINAIPDEVLQRYFSSEISDESIVQQQMRALLPRIISSFVQGKEFGILGRYGTFNYCQFANDKLWLESEKQFMQDFALTYFDLYVNHSKGWTKFSEFEGAIDIVTMFYMAGLNIQPLLELWMSSLDKLLACLYLALIVRMDMEDGRFHSIFTEDDPAYSMLMNTWLVANAKKIANALIAATLHADFIKLDDGDRFCITEGLSYFQNLSNDG